MAKPKPRVLAFCFNFPFSAALQREMALISGESGFSFWFQFCRREGAGVYLPSLTFNATLQMKRENAALFERKDLNTSAGQGEASKWRRQHSQCVFDNASLYSLNCNFFLALFPKTLVLEPRTLERKARTERERKRFGEATF